MSWQDWNNFTKRRPFPESPRAAVPMPERPRFCYGCKYLAVSRAVPPNERLHRKYSCELLQIEKMTVPPIACERYEATPDKPTEGAKDERGD